MQLLHTLFLPSCECVYTCMHAWYGVLCIQQTLLISTETWHRHLCIFSPHTSSLALSHTPAHTHTYMHTYIHARPHCFPPPRPPDSPSWNIPLMGFVLWGYGRVSSHKWISPHIPLSIKEPVCAPTAARRTPLQLFVLSDTSTCSLYTCVVCAPATCISCTQQWDSFLPYCISHVLLFMCASHCFTSFSHRGCWIC